jgi:hypothetical protein
MGASGNPSKRAREQAEAAAARAEYDELDLQAGELEDFDAYWDQQDRQPHVTTIMGERVELPPSLPLQFELEARRMQRSRKDSDVRKLVAILFGEDMTERWAEKGMDAQQFELLLAWAPQVIAGEKVTLSQVREQLRQFAGDADPS